MRIFDVVSESSSGSRMLRASIRPDAAELPFTAWFKVDGATGPLAESGDPFVVEFLTACMFEGEDIHVDAPVSSVLLEGLERGQNVLKSWYSDLRPITVTAAAIDTVRTEGGPPRRTGCCFSGGVDGWYSLLKHEPAVTDLLLIRGFDISLDNDVLWEQAASTARRVGEALGKRVITVSTNLRGIADKRRCAWGRRFDGDFWGLMLHGGAIASVGLALRNDFSTLIIAATHRQDRLRPWGSSPLLDPHWSDGRIRFLHDGCEASRLDKVRSVASCDLALQTLRVCFFNTDRMNCSRCEKCQRTMMALRACGALERSPAFPSGLDLRTTRRLSIPRHVLPRYEEILDVAEAVGDIELAHTCRVILGQSFSADRTLWLGLRRVRETVRALNRAWAI